MSSTRSDTLHTVNKNVGVFYLIISIFAYLVSDTLDDIFDESGDEEEQDAIVNQVLDEIGIEISGKVNIRSHTAI